MSSYGNDSLSEPQRFRFAPKPNQPVEDYVLVADACRYLGKAAGSIHRIYPGLWRRHATSEERVQLADAGIISRDQALVTIMRAEEFDRILDNDTDAFKVPPLPVARATTDGILLQQLEREPPTAKELGKKATQLGTDAHRLMRLRDVRRPHNPFGSTFKVLKSDGNIAEQRSAPSLAPINIDIDEDNFRIRDSFCWNVYEPEMVPEIFVKSMCDELEVPYEKVGHLILAQMKEQIAHYIEYASANIKTSYIKSADRRILIKLHLHVGNTRLVDQFEWDLSNDDTAPEMFAQTLCADLSLGGEYAAGIAHSIREQLLTYRKVLVDTPHEREELQPVAFPPLRTGKLEYYGPYLEAVSEQDIEAYLKQKEREARRMRRSRRRGDAGGSRRSARTGY